MKKDKTTLSELRALVLKAMKDKDWKQSDVARRSGLSRVKVCRILKGTDPRYTEAMRLIGICD